MGNNKDIRPEWVDENNPENYTTNIAKGVEEKDSINKTRKNKKRELTLEEIFKGVLNKNKMILGRAITLIESNNEIHRNKATSLLKKLLPYTGKTVRIGISGVPGAGKSTLIESFGLYLISKGLKVAVLAVDPSSSRFGGSILGDKTRMEELAKNENSFIRPSPSGGSLGGVTRKTRESILLCEAAGFDVILVETVGVGQNEIAVREMVDFFLLILISGAGDELQGIKKGVIEIADALVINKADGNNIEKAKLAASEYRQAFKYLENATEGWETKVKTCSALNGDGIPEIWDMINEFKEITKKSGIFDKRRREQNYSWVKAMTENRILEHFYNNSRIAELMSKIEKEIINGKILPTEASDLLIKKYLYD